MSRHGARKRRSIWGREEKWARKLTNRAWRRQGKHLREDAPPQRSTQGWLSW